MRKRRGRKKGWKSGPSFFEEEGELGNDIKKAVNRIEYSRVENDINKQCPILIFISSSPPITKIPIILFFAFFLSISVSSGESAPSARKGGGEGRIGV